MQFSVLVKPSSCSRRASWTTTFGSIGGGLFAAPLTQGTETTTAIVSAMQVDDPHAVGTATVIVKKIRKLAGNPSLKMPKSPTTTTIPNSTGKKP